MPRTSRSAAWRGLRRSPPRCCFWPPRTAAASPAATCWSTAACALSEPVGTIVCRSAQTGRRAALPTGQSGRSHLVRRISMPKLQGKVALVTGGSSGIGLATAKRFVEEGAFVYITARRQTELDKAALLIGRNVAAVRGDVSKLADLDRLYTKIASEKGKIAILFGGAGIVDPQPLAETTEESFDKLFAINTRALAFTVKKALPLLNDGGAIIVTTSIAENKGIPRFTAYSATPSFVPPGTAESKDPRIRVNAICLGPIDTPIFQP